MQYVDLSKNYIYNIKPLQLLHKIEYLNLSNNEIIEIINLPNLIKLDLMHNFIIECQINMPNLIKLELSFNLITEANINAINLKEISLYNNKLKHINIYNSMNLIKLDLTRNFDLIIEDDIKKFKKLKSLSFFFY